jgi:redox-sensitive bicupin YhaK (pirin superfamily)
MTTIYRNLEQVIQGKATQDGAGVKLTRVLTQDLQHRLDPFLMLDAFGSDIADEYIAGFPDHPHRGFETITYMIAGRMRHRDSQGHEGLLQNGGVQWMTAGRGLIHSEMPEQEQGRMEGFQLWLNLPSQLKLCEPAYQDIQSENIPSYTTPEGIYIRVIAGQSQGITGAMTRPQTDPLYLDIQFEKEGEFKQTIASSLNAFIYVYRGELEIVGTQKTQTLQTAKMGILDHQGEALHIKAKQGTRAILIAGKPLNEPIVQYGPFVMNTREQIMQAFEDYQAGRMH